jgi:phosphopantetheinyl transferase (holo-ACP synthase)
VLGNDLVDLKQAAKDSNWQRKGYLNKICTSHEQQFILEDDAAETMLWLIWTMKEASYKAVNRLTGLRSYSPRSYACSNLIIRDNEATGLVSFESCTLSVKAELSIDKIHSSAVFGKDQLNLFKIYYLNNSPDYANDFQRSNPDHMLSKNLAGLPLITHLPTSRTWEASVSHHGRYAAILCAAPLHSGSPQSAG